MTERDIVNSTANLSTWRHLTNQSTTPESGIMERRHQRHVSRLRRPFPIPNPPARLASLAAIFPIWPGFLPLPPTAEPGPRLAGGVLLKGDPYPQVSLQNQVFLNQNTSQRGPPTLTAMIWIPSLNILELQTFFPASSETPQVRGGEKRVLF